MTTYISCIMQDWYWFALYDLLLWSEKMVCMHELSMHRVISYLE